MSSVDEIERAVEGLSPVQFQEFLLWLRGRVGVRLGESIRPGVGDLAAHDARVESGEVEPFRYVDLEALPQAARSKAESMISDWQARYGR